jgi:hypothetical protein
MNTPIFHRPRPSRPRVILTAAYHALHFFLTAAAFFTLLMFGLFGLAVALEKGLGDQALPAVLWVTALLILSSLAIAHGISKTRQ